MRIRESVKNYLVDFSAKRVSVKNYLVDFSAKRVTPSPTPLTENHFAKKKT